MKGLSRLKHLWFWTFVPVVVILEVTMQWWIPRQTPSEADWRAAEQAVKELKKSDDLIIIAPEWAVQGRMYFKDLMTFKDFGRFDTTTYRRIFEVSIGNAKHPETVGMTPEETMQFGNLTVSRYRLPEPAEIRYSFTDSWKEAQYDNTERRSPKIIIDHWFHPRRVLQFSVRHTSSITFEEVPLGGLLRGYAVIGYREGRFDKGDPIRLRIYLDDKRIGEEMVANFSPIEPFQYPLPGSGTGTVRFEVYAKDNKNREFGVAADVRERGDR
jgi:hypothetical protein